MPEVTYPVGYGRDEMTLSQIAAKYGPNCEPTFFARFLAWLPTTGGKIGIGSGVRSVQPVGPTFAPGTKTFHMIQTYVDGTKWYSAFDLVCRTSNGKAVATREQATGTHSSGAIPQSWVPLQGGAEANLRGVHINVGSPGSSGFEVWHLQPVEQDGYDSWAKAGRKRPDPNREFPGKNKPPVPPVEPPPVTAYADMPPMPTLTVYPQPNTMEGWAVLQFQAWMNRYHAQGNRYPQVVVDGYYGPKTGDAVKAFQASKQLAPDGICGPGTWNAVVAGPLKVVMPGDATPDYDWQVEIIQMSLNLFRFQRGEKLIPITAETAGKYTIETTAAILDFQAAKGLKVDGIVGSVTYRALFTGA